MITNTDATLFSRRYNPSKKLDDWIKVYVPKAWWFKNERAAVTTDGLNIEDVTTVRIPDITLDIKKDDCLVKGNCNVKINTAKDLAGQEYIKVTSVNKNMFGDNPHIKAVGV